jgi:hypothetical protein
MISNQYESILHEYMDKRPEYVMNMMNRFFKLGEVKKVKYIIPAGNSIMADGFQINKSFTALYFNNSEVSLTASNKSAQRMDC